MQARFFYITNPLFKTLSFDSLKHFVLIGVAFKTWK